MGERCVRNAQAGGSNPPISTKKPSRITLSKRFSLHEIKMGLPLT